MNGARQDAFAREEDLLEGKTLGVDATTLEACAALRSIVRRGTGASVTNLACRCQAQGERLTPPSYSAQGRDEREKSSDRREHVAEGELLCTP